MVSRSRRCLWALAALVALAVPLVAGAQDSRGSCQLLSAGNDFYTIYMWDHPNEEASRGNGCDVGSYGVLTGPDHPAGPGLQVLQNGALPQTSFNSVRSYTSDTDYALSDGSTLQNAARGFVPLSVAEYGTAAEIDDETLRAFFFLPGAPSTPDSMEVIVEVSVQGATFEESAVRVSTTVNNFLTPTMGGQALHVGIRHLWDFAIDTLEDPDLGPAFRYLPITSWIEEEFDDTTLTFDQYEMVADPSSTYSVFGTALGPDRLEPTVPDRLQYVCAPRAALTAYDYTTGIVLPGLNDSNCSPDEDGDSGVAYYFESGSAPPPLRGIDEGIEIPAGSSYTVTSYIFSQAPADPGALCLSLELDATQVSGNLGINNLQNNDIVCGDQVLDPILGGELASRGDEPGTFELFFDGSDVGITRTIIDGMDILEPLPPIGPPPPPGARGEENGALDVLLSFNQAHSIPPLGLVLQSDIVRFVAGQNGAQTQGHFERFFDGSDIGLTAGGENIDALQLLPPFPVDGAAARGDEDVVGHLIFSTSGNGAAQGISWRDEDLVGCYNYRLAPGAGGDIQSSCEYLLLVFDGSAVGLAAASEDIDAFAVDLFQASNSEGSGPAILLSTRGNFAISGVSGRNEDVFACVPEEPDQLLRGGVEAEPVLSCSHVEIVFDGSDYRLGSNNVFSIDLLSPAPECAGRGSCAARD